MDWSAIGAVGELIGALAVVVSLVYLSRQVRQNTRALRTANAATVKQNFQSIARAFITDRGASDIVIRALKCEPLSPAEKLSAYAWFFDLLKSGELAYSQYLSDDLDEPVWDASLQFFLAYWTTPGMREYWRDRRHAFTPEFREAMDGWLDSKRGHLTRSDAMYSAADEATVPSLE
ncbi:MAG: hypothetical protein P8188_18585 [Gemmatimonadota bacterium]